MSLKKVLEVQDEHKMSRKSRYFDVSNPFIPQPPISPLSRGRGLDLLRPPSIIYQAHVMLMIHNNNLNAVKSYPKIH